MRAKPWEVFELPSLDRTVEFEIAEPEKPLPKIAVDLAKVPAWRMRPMPPGRRKPTVKPEPRWEGERPASQFPPNRNRW